MKKIDFPAVIFAGGKSRRMGRDKSLLPFGNSETLVEFQFKRMQKIFSEVYISWKNPKIPHLEKFSIFDEPQFSEISAPTVALYSVMKKIENEKLFVLSVDTPFFSENAIRELFKKSENSEITSPTFGGKSEPLLSIYKTDLQSRVLEMLKNGEYKMNKLFKNANLVEFDDKKLFTNMNFPEDYKRNIV
ncbi:molybdopterin-guanine dinucleotide biosynthesis protein A [Thiovulum sp. ES]|nr:molybdopterin-guanine dinucleotide biosynthesis protein A [Thiovulum sp. ES]